MAISTNQLRTVIFEQLPDFIAVGKLQKLRGGNLNHVWRLKGKEENIIIKYAPPHIAANTDVPLSPDRLDFEAGAMMLFEEGRLLQSVASPHLFPPALLAYDRDSHILIMEDMGAIPNISEWLSATAGDVEIGGKLGRFIADLHRTTFNNINIQKSRLEVQYKPAAGYAEKAGIKDTALIRSATESLGQFLLSPGKCLTMGDLWPPSLLIKNGGIRIIDWEFAHYGRPLQDIVHLAAHCWMQAQTKSTKKETIKYKQLWLNFWGAYQKTLADDFSSLFDEREFKDMTLHCSAEILVRSTGPFKQGYVYQDYAEDDPIIKQAGAKAKQLIISKDFNSLWK